MPVTNRFDEAERAETHAVAFLGRCLEVGPTHIVLDIRPDDDDAREPVLIGFANIIQMRAVPDTFLRRRDG
jgi:hypothetical protein